MDVYSDSLKSPTQLFQSFEIRGYILNNQKILIGLGSCSRSSLFLIFWVPFDTIQSLNRLPYQIQEIPVCLSLVFINSSCQADEA